MADCGTNAGYHAHRRRGEKACRACMDAANRYNLSRRRLSAGERRLRRDERPTLGRLVVDVLESYCGEWLSTGEVVDACVVARPGVNRRSVERVLHRLEGVEHRPPDEWSRESRWRVEWRSYWT